MDKNKEMFDRLVKGLRDIYGDKLVSILLYGSFARKTNTGIPLQYLSDRDLCAWFPRCLRN